jgi:hypothetical protein
MATSPECAISTVNWKYRAALDEQEAFFQSRASSFHRHVDNIRRKHLLVPLAPRKVTFFISFCYDSKL